MCVQCVQYKRHILIGTVSTLCISCCETCCIHLFSAITDNDVVHRNVILAYSEIEFLVWCA